MGKFGLSEVAFRELAERVSNAGRWGAHDALGALNHITDATRREAMGLARDGITVPCGLTVPTDAASAELRPDRAHGGTWEAVNERLSLELHGWPLTHLDALGHVAYDGCTYNDRPVTLPAPAATGIVAAREGILARGVLIDLPRTMGLPFLQPGQAARLDDVRRALGDAGLALRTGDVPLFRFGTWQYERVTGGAVALEAAPGISVDCAEWLHASDPALIVSDFGLDVAPSEVEGVPIPMHVLTLARMGIRLVDCADLDALAETCERLGRWEFLLVIAPVAIEGATSSPVNPVAVF